MIRGVSRFKEDTFHLGDSFPAFQETMECQSALLSLSACQITLIKVSSVPLWDIFGWPVLGPNNLLVAVKSVQMAEFIVFIRSCQIAPGKRVNICTESRYAFWIVWDPSHSHQKPLVGVGAQ